MFDPPEVRDIKLSLTIHIEDPAYEDDPRAGEPFELEVTYNTGTGKVTLPEELDQMLAVSVFDKGKFEEFLGPLVTQSLNERKEVVVEGAQN